MLGFLYRRWWLRSGFHGCFSFPLFFSDLEKQQKYLCGIFHSRRCWSHFGFFCPLIWAQPRAGMLPKGSEMCMQIFFTSQVCLCHGNIFSHQVISSGKKKKMPVSFKAHPIAHGKKKSSWPTQEAQPAARTSFYDSGRCSPLAPSTWLSCRCPCSLQRSWNRWPLKVPSYSNDSMTVWWSCIQLHSGD